MDFGIPNLKKAKTEKFSNLPLLTLLETGEGLNRKMTFNSKAAELLGFDKSGNDKVSFSFSDDKVFIVNTSKDDSISQLAVGKNLSMSNKRYYEFIKKVLSVDLNSKLYLLLTPTQNSYNNNNVYELIVKSESELNYLESGNIDSNINQETLVNQTLVNEVISETENNINNNIHSNNINNTTQNVETNESTEDIIAMEDELSFLNE